ncbi:hypothetical protein GCM10010140_54880 [Streptosporangium pseudovulgare]|uniref:Uncharacterized protein n=1 Tax=Streptosporangium pseudovulgare TaxID=35765 RepID=A0ABQ2RAV9_9ACTN|nr:hypothetical protein GCM10010140_54880 [Streptosporangium pseudovulgare]
MRGRGGRPDEAEVLLEEGGGGLDVADLQGEEVGAGDGGGHGVLPGGFEPESICQDFDIHDGTHLATYVKILT